MASIGRLGPRAEDQTHCELWCQIRTGVFTGAAPRPPLASHPPKTKSNSSLGSLPLFYLDLAHHAHALLHSAVLPFLSRAAATWLSRAAYMFY